MWKCPPGRTGEGSCGSEEPRTHRDSTCVNDLQWGLPAAPRWELSQGFLVCSLTLHVSPGGRLLGYSSWPPGLGSSRIHLAQQHLPQEGVLLDLRGTVRALGTVPGTSFPGRGGLSPAGPGFSNPVSVSMEKKPSFPGIRVQAQAGTLPANASDETVS